MGLICGVRAHRARRDRGCIEMAALEPRRAPMIPAVEHFCPEHAPSTHDLQQRASRRDFSLLTALCVPRTLARRGSHTRSGRPSTGHRLVPPAALVEDAPGCARRGTTRRQWSFLAESPNDERAGCPNVANPENETASLPFLGPPQQVGKTASKPEVLKCGPQSPHRHATAIVNPTTYKSALQDVIQCSKQAKR